MDLCIDFVSTVQPSLALSAEAFSPVSSSRECNFFYRTTDSVNVGSTRRKKRHTTMKRKTRHPPLPLLLPSSQPESSKGHTHALPPATQTKTVALQIIHTPLCLQTLNSSSSGHLASWTSALACALRHPALKDKIPLRHCPNLWTLEVFFSSASRAWTRFLGSIRHVVRLTSRRASHRPPG